MDSLVEIDKSKWPELRDLYNQDWPKNVVAFCILDTEISYPDLAETFGFKIYCPVGDIRNGMIATSGNDKFCQLKVHPLNGVDKIEEALASTKVIDWGKYIIVASASPEVEECFRRLAIRLGLEVQSEKAFKHLLDRDSELLVHKSIPRDTYIDVCKHKDLNIIDRTWTYHGKNTYTFFETLARNDLVFVLYSNDNNPLAWAAIDDHGALTHLYCIEEHRRKGYAEYVTKYVVNNQLKKGKPIIAYTLENNFKPKNLFDKLNFKRVGYDQWLRVYKI